ncbi:MAG: threonine-phosphate decarboxylase, partial [Pseudomonadota bacterium]
MAKSLEAPFEAVTDHGGNLSHAAKLFPEAPRPWLDLSTGINPHSYPFAALPASTYTRLPDNSRLAALADAAANTYGAPSPVNIVAAPGTQLLLPMTAALANKGQAVILSPTYAEHRRAAAIAGHVPVETSEIADLDTADLA